MRATTEATGWTLVKLGLTAAATGIVLAVVEPADAAADDFAVTIGNGWGTNGVAAPAQGASSSAVPGHAVSGQVALGAVLDDDGERDRTAGARDAVTAGANWAPLDGTRLRLGYRGRPGERVDSRAPVPESLETGGAWADTLSLGATQRFTPRWRGGIELAWKDSGGDGTAAALADWRNDVAASVTTSYRAGRAWGLMAGAAYDDAATYDDAHQPGDTGSDRVWAGVSAHWQAAPSTAVRLGFTHVVADSGPVNLDRDATGAGAAGDFAARAETSANILALDLTARF